MRMKEFEGGDVTHLNKEQIYKNDEKNLDGNETKKLSFIHFNDVYNIESRVLEPVGGASRFVTAVHDLLKADPSTIVFFSGDAFNPSMCKRLFDSCFLFLNNFVLFLYSKHHT